MYIHIHNHTMELVLLELRDVKLAYQACAHVLRCPHKQQSVDIDGWTTPLAFWAAAGAEPVALLGRGTHLLLRPLHPQLRAPDIDVQPTKDAATLLGKCPSTEAAKRKYRLLMQMQTLAYVPFLPLRISPDDQKAYGLHKLAATWPLCHLQLLAMQQPDWQPTPDMLDDPDYLRPDTATTIHPNLTPTWQADKLSQQLRHYCDTQFRQDCCTRFAAPAPLQLKIPTPNQPCHIETNLQTLTAWKGDTPIDDQWLRRIAKAPQGAHFTDQGYVQTNDNQPFIAKIHTHNGTTHTLGTHHFNQVQLADKTPAWTQHVLSDNPTGERALEAITQTNELTRFLQPITTNHVCAQIQGDRADTLHPAYGAATTQ